MNHSTFSAPRSCLLIALFSLALTAPLPQAATAQTKKAAAIGCVIYKQHSSDQFSFPLFLEFTSRKAFPNVINLVTPDGSLERVFLEQTPIFIPYPNDPNGSREDAAVMIGLARQRFPKAAPKLVLIEKAWAAVPLRNVTTPPSIAASPPQKRGTALASITTTDGTTYEAVEITKVNPGAISFTHSAGVATVAFEKLPPDLQRRFNNAPTPTVPSVRSVASATDVPMRQIAMPGVPGLDPPVGNPAASPGIPSQPGISHLMAESKSGGLGNDLPNGDDKQSDGAGFEGAGPAPVIRSVALNPGTELAEPGRVNLTLSGANFVRKPEIFLIFGTGGTATLTKSVTFVSSNRVDVSVATNVTPDKWTFFATNPDGKKSNGIVFQVVATAPANVSMASNGSSDATDESLDSEHLVKGSDGHWHPAPGYRWVNGNGTKDKSVVKVKMAADRISNSKAIVTTLKEHEEFFADLRQVESLIAFADQARQKAEKLKSDETFIPNKDEFETSADYQKRVGARKARNEMEVRKFRDEAEAMIAKGIVAKTAILQKEKGLGELIISIKVKMGPYDADRGIVISFLQELSILGAYGGRTAAIIPGALGLTDFSCPVGVARRLREASDKGELFCTVKIGSPNLELAHDLLKVPKTKVDKVEEGAGRFLGGMALYGLGKLLGTDTAQAANEFAMSANYETKGVDSNVIRILDFASIKIINLYNKAGEILAK